MTILIKCGTLFDGVAKHAAPHMAVVVRGNRIAEIVRSDAAERRPDLAEASIIDASDKWVMPGLINVHEHLVFRDLIGNPMGTMAASPTQLTVNAVRNALTALRRGWTTVRDMGAAHGISLAFRDFIANGFVPGPRVLACGSPICVTGGHANAVCIEADGPYEVRKAVRSQLHAGADFIKVMASHDPVRIDGPEKTRPEMALDEIRAAFDEAKAHGKRTACHVMGTVAIGRVLDAGVDVISHGFYLNDELAQRMVEQGVYLDPTLSSYGRQTLNPQLQRGDKWAEEHRPLVPAMEAAFQAAIRAGVKIVTGTDSAGRYAEDVAMMRELGLGAHESLLACTRHAAEALGISQEVGTIEVGKSADLVVLDGDPLTDPYRLESVSLVVQAGQAMRPEAITLHSLV
jgi:imidazolonepropionase-like amidohydrolase